MEQDIETIMVRTFTGESSAEDIVRLSEWLALGEENRAIYRKAASYWHASVSPATPFDDKGRVLEQLLRRTGKPSGRRLPAWIRYAGVAVLALALWGVAYRYAPSARSAGQHYTLLSGAAVSTFRLPDSTEVSLNANSTLRYTEAFGDRQRDVSLEGEAFFRVAKDREKKFTVHLNEDTRIVALGTSFSVRFLPGEDSLLTTLVEGSIRFETPGQAVTLAPNKQLACNLRDHEISITATDGESAVAWKDHLLKYKSIPFAEAVALLEKQYRVDIELTGEDLGQRKVSGAFDMNLSVGQVLDMMKKSLSFQWYRKDGRYVIIQ
jgi:ferric-dicitrate binding protein FerR (iron transport regulator)